MSLHVSARIAGQVWEKKQHAGPLPEFHCLSVGSFMKVRKI